MESLDLGVGLDFGSFSLPPPPDELSSLFLEEGVDSVGGIDVIDDEWWQGLGFNAGDVAGEPVGGSPVDGSGVCDGDGAAAGAAPSSSCSSPSPQTPFRSEPDVVPAAVVSECGSKRSGVSSPDCEEDDPKRVRRLEKNREAASQSRARKKSYVKELEVKCRMLEAHVAQLQRAMTVTSMENSALKDELVRVKKPKDSAKSGVAEPAVLESNSLPSEFLRYHSWHYPTGQQVASHAAGRYPRFLLPLLQLLLLAAASGSSGPQVSLSRALVEGGHSVPVGMDRVRAGEGGLVVGSPLGKRKKSRRQYDLNFRSPSGARGSRRRKVKRIRSKRIL